MPNPTLTDKVFERRALAQPGATEVGWASPTGTATALPPAATGAAMRVGGVASAAGVLLLVVLVTGWFGWEAVTVTEGTDAAGRQVVEAEPPGWLFAALFVGFGIAIVTFVFPKLARVTAPLYAVAEGLLLGAVSRLYEAQFDGIVLQAVGLTFGVFLTMLFLYGTRIIKVTNRLRTGIIAATFGVLLVYAATWILRIFGADVPFIHGAGPLGIGFSLVVVGIAAFNLLLDFDIIERGVQMGAPRYMEWYAAFGLLVTLVWLYLELLRLLSKLRR